jgi:hypothetical protein
MAANCAQTKRRKKSLQLDEVDISLSRSER